MCGVVGFCVNRSLTEADIRLGRNSLEMLEHRGPDGQGEWYDRERGIYLGHRRLSIIDTSSSSDQPININESTISFNGELYNFIELRNELISQSCNFMSNGDGEVLLQAWRHWGSKALDKFDGMFAFALYDGECINLVTDPFGEKPLYILNNADGVFFSSEAQVLVDLFKLEFSPSPHEIAEFMAIGHFQSGTTGFRGLEVLPPSSHICLANGEIVTRTKYWSPPEPYLQKGKIRPLTENDIDIINMELLESLQLRIRSDLPVGVFLSGGIDSSLVAAMISRDLGLRVQTLTVAYPDGADESAEASRIAKHLELPHIIVDSCDDDGWMHLPYELKRLYGVPNDNTTVLSVEQISNIAKRYMSVAICGTGGDEIFYGYNKYKFLYDNRLLYKWLSPLTKFLMPLDPILNKISSWQIAKKLLNGTRDWQFLSLKNNGQGELLKEISDMCGWKGEVLNNYEEAFFLSVRGFDINTMLPGSYIPAIDRGSMRASLEVRTPFLSRRLVETVAQFDQRSLLAFGQKDVLRRILSRYIPRTLTDGPKQGFVFPTKRYLSQDQLTTPILPFLSDSIIERIWSNRLDVEYKSLAIRLSILSTFLHG